jgi:hypothetical protein
MRDTPKFYDDLDATLDEIWALWIRGAHDRHCAFHEPTIVTHAGDWPAARTVILRDVDRNARALVFHTDRRARKVDELARDDRAVVHVWDSKRSIQVRARAIVAQAPPEQADAAWEQLSDRGRALYGIEPSPATTTDEPVDMPDSLTESARDNFVVLHAEVIRLEWLFLFHAGHRRAIFEWNDGRWNGEWWVP